MPRIKHWVPEVVDDPKVLVAQSNDEVLSSGCEAQMAKLIDDVVVNVLFGAHSHTKPPNPGTHAVAVRNTSRIVNAGFGAHSLSNGLTALIHRHFKPNAGQSDG